MTDFTWHAAAEGFLQEFGGIRCDISGPGVTCAREPFEIDPELAVGEADRFAEFSKMLGQQLFPVGETGRGEFFLAIDEESAIYLLASSLQRYGAADEALKCLITGVAAVRLAY